MATDVQNSIEERLRRREDKLKNPLQTQPEANLPHGNIPNTPFAASVIAFLLGAIFSLGALTFLVGGFDRFWWSTYQLGFFVAAWAGFHWGEFAVTAGWNLEKCSVDCKRRDILLKMQR
jgi:protein-S-isoprenylcysteine O-methyltransferase